jgi:hypothetical protein
LQQASFHIKGACCSFKDKIVNLILKQMKIRQIVAVLSLMVAFLVSSCQYDVVVEPELPPIDPEVPISFKDEIAPIFSAANCLGCHGGNINPNLNPDAAYNSIVPAHVDTANPEESTIYFVPAPGGNHAQKYTNSQAALLLGWIEQGAKNN